MAAAFKVKNSQDYGGLETENIYAIFELLKRFNGFISVYAKDLDMRGDELDTMAHTAQIMSENITDPDAAFTPVNNHRFLDNFLGASLELFTNLYSRFVSSDNLERNKVHNLIVPCNEFKVYMEMTLKNMVMYVLVLSQLEHSLNAACERWQTVCVSDLVVLLDQHDIFVHVDKNLNLNMRATKQAAQGSEEFVTAFKLYSALLTRTIQSFENKTFIKLLGDMEDFSRRLAKQITTRRPIQLKRGPPVLNENNVTNNPNPAHIEMHFLSGDVDANLRGPSKSGELLRELFAPNQPVNCKMPKKSPFITLAYGADGAYNEDASLSGVEGFEEGGRDFPSRDSDDESGSEDSGNEQMEVDDDMKKYKQTLSSVEHEQDSKHAELNRVLTLLEEELDRVSGQLPLLDSSDAKPYEKLSTIKCLYNFLQKYLQALHETGEEVYRDLTYTLAPDMTGFVNLLQQEDTGIRFINDLHKGLEEGTAYVCRHIGLAKAILDKFLELQINIARAFDRFIYVKSQATILSTLMDSHIKTIMSTLHTSGTVLYNCLPAAIVPDLFTHLYSNQITLNQKYQLVKKALIKPQQTHQYFVQINSFVLRSLEEILLNLNNQVAGEPSFFDNSEVATSYGAYYDECVQKFWDFAGAYAYLLIHNDNEIENSNAVGGGTAAPAAPAPAPTMFNMTSAAANVTPATVMKTPQLVVKQTSNEFGKNAFELAAIDKELPVNSVRYYKCVSACVAATRSSRRSMPFLVFNFLHSIEPAIVIDSIYNLLTKATQSAVVIISALDKLVDISHYIEDKAAKTVIDDPLNIPPMAATLYKRLLTVALALAPAYTTKVVVGEGATITITDQALKNHLTKLFTKKTFIKALESSQSIKMEREDNIVFFLDNKPQSQAIGLTVRPEYFKDIAAAADTGDYPLVGDYLISTDALRETDIAHSALFPRANEKYIATDLDAVEGRLALLNNMGTCLGHNIVNIQALAPANQGVYTLHPYQHKLSRVEFKMA